jgi:hypothetical protein
LGLPLPSTTKVAAEKARMPETPGTLTAVLATLAFRRHRTELHFTSGDRSIANIGWLYQHDAAAVA